MHLASWRSYMKAGPLLGTGLPCLRVHSRTYADESAPKGINAVEVKQPSSATIEWRRKRAIQDDVEGRALYRSLLREASYFPDAWARSYMRGQIVRRFKIYHKSELQTSMSWHEWIQRKLAIRKKARKYLHGMERANAGKHKDYNRILLRAYGRLGERRRRLLQEVQPLEVPADEVVKQPAVNRYVPSISAKLQALVASQNQALILHGTVSKAKRPGALQPKIPDVNSWNRPMPPIRVKHLTEEWWAGFLERVSPPLPVHEWLRLYDLVTGAKTEADPKKQGGVIKRETDPLETLVTSRNSRMHLRENLERNVNLRKRQRAWREIFKICPVIQREDGKWRVIWGYQALHDTNIAETIRDRARDGTAYTFRVAGERDLDQRLFDEYLCKNSVEREDGRKGTKEVAAD